MKTLRLVSRCIQWVAVFVVGLLLAGVAGAADVSFYGVIRGENYYQGNPTTPILRDEQGDDGRFFFNTFVDLTSTNAVTNATVQVPISGLVKTLQLNEWGDGQELHDNFQAPLFLDAAYPNGDYVLVLKTKNDGTKTITLTMSGSFTNVSIPVVNNYNALQAVAAASSFNVTWAVSGGLASDYVQLEIREVNPNGGDTQVYQSPQPGEAGALTGTSTTATIPVNKVFAGKIYQGRLMVARGTFNTTLYGGGVGGVVAYTRRTEFPLVASGVDAGDTQAPQLNTSTPYNGDGNVPTNAVVGFTFNERMKTNVSVASSIQWSGGGIDGAKFSYAWSPDSKTLYCVYNTSLPTGSTIQWTLNPNGTSQNLRDLADNKFSADFQGQFTTAATGSSGVKDVKKVFVYKGKAAVQTNATGPVALSLFFFGMSANLAAVNTVTNGSLTVPSGNVLTPQREDYPYGDSFEIDAKYGTQANLDAFFPSTTTSPATFYTVTLKTVHDGTKTVSLSLSGNSYPNLPNISNFTLAQTVDPASSFPVNWGSFTTGTANDYIRLQVENEQGNTVFQTAEPGDVGALTGTAITTTIPAGKLYPGRKYQARLLFIKIKTPDTTTYPGVTFAPAYTSETQFNLATTGTPIKPQLSVQPFNSGQFVLRLTGEPLMTYTIDWSDTLQGGSWSQIWTQNADDSGHIDFTDFNSFGQARRFYRAREGYFSSGN